MEKTLLIGDHLFVNRYVYGPQPSKLEQVLLPGRGVRRGDIVIFRSPEEPTLDLVKRCVGLPGDEIEFFDKELSINGVRIEDAAYTQHLDAEVYTRGFPKGSNPRRRDNFGPFNVPDEHLFCLGDNRDHSHDSRFFGAVPMAHIKGRASLIYWSYGGETPDGNWYGWRHRIGQLGKTMLGFLPKTRWKRTLRIIR